MVMVRGDVWMCVRIRGMLWGMVEVLQVSGVKVAGPGPRLSVVG